MPAGFVSSPWTLAEITSFQSQFDSLYVQKLDEGETQFLPTVFDKATCIACVRAMRLSSRF